MDGSLTLFASEVKGVNLLIASWPELVIYPHLRARELRNAGELMDIYCIW